MSGFFDRMLRAARLDAQVYEEVEADADATGQAMLVVVLSSVAAGIGTAGEGAPGLVLGVVAALVSWFIWAFLTYFIGTRVLPAPQTEANVGQLLRTIGFASSPGLLRALGIVPGVGSIAILVSSVWMLVAMVIAVRQALDYDSTPRAVGVCVIGWVVQFAFFAAVLLLLGALGVARAAG